MGKWLALDIGTKRVGYAVSDENHEVAFPRETLKRLPKEVFFTSLRRIAKEEGIERIIVGVPLDSDNHETKFSKTVKEFGQEISRICDISVVFVDEFGSTDEALSKIPFRSDRREKGKRDAIAAQIILQRYIQEQKHR